MFHPEGEREIVVAPNLQLTRDQVEKQVDGAGQEC